MAAARFYDGHRASSHLVKLTLQTSALELGFSADDGRPPLRWNYSRIMIIGNPQDGVPIRLSCDETPDARLEIMDEKLWQGIYPRLKAHRKQPLYIPLRLSLVSGLAIASLVVMVALYQLFNHAAHLVAPMVPQSVKVSVSELALEKALDSPRICHTEEGTAALTVLQQRLAAATDGRYHGGLSVVEHEAVNAITLPDHRIVVFSGLLAQADGPDEVAAVIAHEMGHAIEDHAAEGMVRALGMRFLFMMMIGQGAETVSPDAVMQLVLQTTHQREAERAADIIGLEILQKSYIQSTGMIGFFHKMQKKEAHIPALMTYISTHPSSQERVAYLREKAHKSPHTHAAALSDTQWQALQSICN